MARLGDFELSGILYAGCDFDAWRDKTDAWLRLRGLESFVSRTKKGEGRSGMAQRLKEKALDAICERVDRAIIRRLPTTIKPDDHLQNFWKQLEEQAKPFRFEDLTPELRCKVYSSILGADASYNLSQWTPSCSLPAILSVCSTVRKEAMPVYYSSTEFRATCKVSGGRDRGIERTRNTMTSWTRSLAHGALQHLRSINLYVAGLSPRTTGPVESFGNLLQFRFSPITGLTCDEWQSANPEVALHYHKSLNVQAKERLQKSLARLEKYREVTSLRGEVLVMAIVDILELLEDGKMEREA
ncbi:unnamed protein product [Zymoseptoria tritici ST99CH_1E4]|uniref:Uncharacterized protein n=1 Tax=Zymoseptoria tritici ST99CH_1E4 TaxID=1276532 RepID=A0A2H1GI71_ZYMTR|nr:unnamed protein product [Zymoseptoria tritici ST99CH_1E4]